MLILYFSQISAKYSKFKNKKNYICKIIIIIIIIILSILVLPLLMPFFCRDMTFFPNSFEEYLHFFKEPVLLCIRLRTVLLDSQICSQSLVLFFSKQCSHHSILSINTLAAIWDC